MATRDKYSEGTFSWTDLSTTDPEGAKSFYGSLFGWEFEDVPLPGGSSYSMARLNGSIVSALYQMEADKMKAGVVSHFLSYITVDDVDVKVMEIEGQAGEVKAAPFDVMEAGRMAVVADPRGAVFALWQPNKRIGAERINEPGCLCWNELSCRDLEGAQGFYEGVFDWTFESMPEADDYVVVKNQGLMNAGMMDMNDKRPADVPEHWGVYFAVEDCDEKVHEAEALGAEVVVGPTDIAPGRFAVLTDPQGATFSIIEMAS